MSEGNADLVRRAFEAATRRPKPDFATMNALFHRDHEYISRIEALEGGVRRGARGYRDWLDVAEESFDWEARIEEVREIDAEQVLAITPTTIRTKGGPPIEQQMTAVVTVRQGKVIRTEFFRSPREALEAVADST